jgi:cation diffusion facilitator CzcD-associated flavoprotein CzcO
LESLKRDRERKMMRVAVVGGGLSGLVAAHELARSGGVRVTVYEKEDHLGGAKTIAVNGGSGPVPVDLDFMVFNRVRIMHTHANCCICSPFHRLVCYLYIYMCQASFRCTQKVEIFSLSLHYINLWTHA